MGKKVRNDASHASSEPMVPARSSAPLIRFGPDWESCKEKYVKGGKWPRILKQFERFVTAKISAPTQMWNASDKRSSPPLSSFYKAHLTHDDSIIYSYDQANNVIRVYGIWSHDDMGTGQPPNRPRTTTLANRLEKQVFETKPKSI
jgi:mRNA-degrading endonuclease YafQ of YafQ-DinJ toxin-antitoxin module